MCKNHDQAIGKAAVQALTEARHDTSVCEDRIVYLEAKVKGFISWLKDQGKDGKAIVLSIHNKHLKAMEEDVFGEFIWTTMREDSDNLICTTAGLDDLEARMDDEHKCHSDYWGQAHRIAYSAFMKTINDETPHGKALVETALSFLDKVESRFEPAASREERLSRSDYQACRMFRARLMMHRFKLHTITHEQWAYLVNYLNILMSIEDSETKEVKQYPCLTQNILVEDKWINPDDLRTEIKEVYYTRN